MSQNWNRDMFHYPETLHTISPLTEAFEAIEYCDLSRLESCMSTILNVNEKRPDGDTLLLAAAKQMESIQYRRWSTRHDDNEKTNKCLDIIKALLSKPRINTDITDGYGKTLRDYLCEQFHKAVGYTYTKVVEKLLTSPFNVDVNYRGEGGKTALMIVGDDVFYHGNESTVAMYEVLLAHGANLDDHDHNAKHVRDYLCEKFYQAVRYNHTKVVEKLLTSPFNVDVNYRGEGGETALMIVGDDEYYEEESIVAMYDVLLAHGANLDDHDHNGKHVRDYLCEQFHKAVRCTYTKVVEKLLTSPFNVDVNYRGKGGKTALMIVGDGYYHYEDSIVAMYEVLQAHGANLDDHDNDGTHVRWHLSKQLCIASSQGHSKLVEYLLKLKADISAKHDGEYPNKEKSMLNGKYWLSMRSGCCLHYAIHYAKVDIMEMLLQHGADPLALDGDDRTPSDVIMYHCQGNDHEDKLNQFKEIISMLKKAETDASINKQQDKDDIYYDVPTPMNLAILDLMAPSPATLDIINAVSNDSLDDTEESNNTMDDDDDVFVVPENPPPLTATTVKRYTGSDPEAIQYIGYLEKQLAEAKEENAFLKGKLSCKNETVEHQQKIISSKGKRLEGKSKQLSKQEGIITMKRGKLQQVNRREREKDSIIKSKGKRIYEQQEELKTSNERYISIQQNTSIAVQQGVEKVSSQLQQIQNGQAVLSEQVFRGDQAIANEVVNVQQNQVALSHQNQAQSNQISKVQFNQGTLSDQMFIQGKVTSQQISYTDKNLTSRIALDSGDASNLEFKCRNIILQKHQKELEQRLDPNHDVLDKMFMNSVIEMDTKNTIQDDKNVMSRRKRLLLRVDADDDCGPSAEKIGRFVSVLSSCRMRSSNWELGRRMKSTLDNP